ncbi:unnamed protein product [Mycena citricolor]|uniref:Uncharacterized protein n=1 Tax=Mycena citricolor TaxID=2018698 RepID=A0AAD2K7S3_9AGAR|nr:unnamed protein product [Mycena citricolor]
MSNSSSANSNAHNGMRGANGGIIGCRIIDQVAYINSLPPSEPVQQTQQQQKPAESDARRGFAMPEQQAIYGYTTPLPLPPRRNANTKQKKA